MGGLGTSARAKGGRRVFSALVLRLPIQSFAARKRILLHPPARGAGHCTGCSPSLQVQGKDGCRDAVAARRPQARQARLAVVGAALFGDQAAVLQQYSRHGSGV